MTKHDEEIARLRRRVAELEEENRRLKKWIEERKIIERAKGVLMVRCRWNEETAFRNMQRYSMRSRRPMPEVARDILDGRMKDFLQGPGAGK